MQRRDRITLNKIVEEIDVAIDMLSDVEQNVFMKDNILKRAAAMSLINIGELVKNLSFAPFVLLRRAVKMLAVPWFITVSIQ